MKDYVFYEYNNNLYGCNVSFKPCCEKLKYTLKDTLLSNPNSKDEPDLIEIKESE